MDTVEVVSLPYAGSGLELTLVLPKAGQFAAVRDQVSSEWLTAVTPAGAYTNVALALPKFKIETSQLKLKQPLEELGMPGIFVAADFSGITDRTLAVKDVIQKAFIGVDEVGTEAAASTAVTFWDSVPPPPEANMVLDRPFLFFLRDKTGLVLFSGQVVDPTK
jgi:serpin B